MAALLCAGGLSLLGNTVWADSGTLYNWIEPDGTTIQITDQDARARCEQCRQVKQQNNGDANINTACTVNIQVCFAVNITF
jgi:hypothetical protein